MLPALEACVPHYFNFGCRPENKGNLDAGPATYRSEGKSPNDVWVEKNAVSKDTQVYVDHSWAGIRTCHKLLPDITAVLKAPNRRSQKTRSTQFF